MHSVSCAAFWGFFCTARRNFFPSSGSQVHSFFKRHTLARHLTLPRSFPHTKRSPATPRARSGARHSKLRNWRGPSPRLPLSHGTLSTRRGGTLRPRPPLARIFSPSAPLYPSCSGSRNSRLPLCSSPKRLRAPRAPTNPSRRRSRSALCVARPVDSLAKTRKGFLGSRLRSCLRARSSRPGTCAARLCDTLRFCLSLSLPFPGAPHQRLCLRATPCVSAHQLHADPCLLVPRVPPKTAVGRWRLGTRRRPRLLANTDVSPRLHFSLGEVFPLAAGSPRRLPRVRCLAPAAFGLLLGEGRASAASGRRATRIRPRAGQRGDSRTLTSQAPPSLESFQIPQETTSPGRGLTPMVSLQARSPGACSPPRSRACG